MRKIQLESLGLEELDPEQQKEISGGYLQILLGAVSALASIYTIGKAVGRELYDVSH